MTSGEKQICEAVLKGAEKVDRAELEIDGIKVESYAVEYGGETYHLTKHNGEWVYFFHIRGTSAE